MASMTMRVRAAGATRDIECPIFWEIEVQLRVPGCQCQVPFCGQLLVTARFKGDECYRDFSSTCRITQHFKDVKESGAGPH
jgi:hypothetical protein